MSSIPMEKCLTILREMLELVSVQSMLTAKTGNGIYLWI